MSKTIILVAGLALAVTACGGVETSANRSSVSTVAVPAPTTAPSGAPAEASPPSPGSLPPIQGVLASYETTATPEITSARIEGSIEFTGLNDEAAMADGIISFGTAFNSTTGDSSFLMDMSALTAGAEIAPEDDPLGLASGFLGETEFRTIGDRVYVKFGFVTALLGADTPWVSMPEEDGSEFTTDSSDVPQDPREILDAYADAEGSIDDLGLESVNGVEATHYRILIDSDSMRLTADERAELEESGLFAAGEIPMDVWFTDDGHMVRLIMEIDGSELDVPPEEHFERMVLRYDVFEINGDVQIEPPPADQVTAIEDLDPFGSEG